MPQEAPKPKGQPPRYTLEEVTRLAREVALKHGSHVPVIIAEGSSGTIVGQLADLPDIHQGRMRYLHAAGQTLAKSHEVGVLQRIYLVSEGWMALPEEDGTIKHPPSQDPNRKEVLFVSSYEIDSQQTELVLFEMIRDGEGQLTSLEQLDQPGAAEGGHAESPLLAAFVEGFRRGSGGKYN